MKYTNKKGFTLVEAIFSLWITVISIMLLTSTLKLLNIDYDSYSIEDSNFINQIQLIYALAEDITIDAGMLNYYYNFENMYFEVYNEKLVLKDGYQIFLNDIKDAYFKEEHNCVYLYYERKEWNKTIIGCK